MNPFVRTLGVTALLALMFGMLGKPIFDAAGRTAPARRERPRNAIPVLPSPTPTLPPVEESPTPQTTLTVAGGPHVVGRYPPACLDRADAVSGAGLVAAWHDGRVQLTAPSGGEIVELPDVQPPVQFSASGRYLVTRGPQLWTSAGETLGPLFAVPEGATIAEPERGIAWSPISDCALVKVADGTDPSLVSLVAARPSVDPTELLRGDIREVAFAPDGTELAFVAKQSGGPASGYELWSLELATGELERLVAFERGIAQVVLAGWDDGTVLYWATPGVSVAADGAQLYGFSTQADARSYTRGATMLTLDPALFLEACAGELVGVLGGDRSFDPEGDGTTRTDAALRLSHLQPGQPPEFITPAGESYYSPTCSPDDRYLVAIAGQGPERRLTLLDTSGAFLRTLTIDEGYADELAIWGPSGTGVLFRRAPAGGGPDVLWFIAEGAPARSLGLSVGSFDWSAERPSGLFGE